MFQKFSPSDIFFLVAVLLVSILYTSGLDSVPFHPDESTRIFMSSDFETFFSHPAALFWQPGNDQDPRQHYRELDAPLDRDLIGLARQIYGLAVLPSDWDWTKSWEENRAAGALPSEDLLHTARLSAAIFFPFSLVLIYMLGVVSGSRLNGWLAAALLGSNALVLLHTRRAMAESILLFTILLALLTMVRLRRFPWLVGAAIGLALCAKQSSAPLFIVGLVAINSNLPAQSDWRGILRRSSIYALCCAGIYCLFNPFLWGSPIAALQASLQARQQLLQAQIQTLASVRPDMVLNTLPQRLAALLAHTYFTPPAIADVGNYLAHTQSAEAAYLANPIHSLLRGLVLGSIMLGLTLFGLVTCTIRALKTKNHALSMILLAALCQLSGLVFFVPLPIQRYVIPLIPFACLFSAFGIGFMIHREN